MAIKIYTPNNPVINDVHHVTFNGTRVTHVLFNGVEVLYDPPEVVANAIMEVPGNTIQEGQNISFISPIPEGNFSLLFNLPNLDLQLFGEYTNATGVYSFDAATMTAALNFYDSDNNLIDLADYPIKELNYTINGTTLNVSYVHYLGGGTLADVIYDAIITNGVGPNMPQNAKFV